MKDQKTNRGFNSSQTGRHVANAGKAGNSFNMQDINRILCFLHLEHFNVT